MFTKQEIRQVLTIALRTLFYIFAGRLLVKYYLEMKIWLVSFFM